jgi:hypothetical protein
LIASHDSKMLQNVIILSQCSIKVHVVRCYKKERKKEKKEEESIGLAFCEVQVSVAILQIKVG